MLVEQAAYFEQHGHSAGTVVGSEYWPQAVFLLSVRVGPGAGVIVGEEQNAVFDFRLIGAHDIAYGQDIAVEGLDFAGLYADVLGSVAGQFGDYIVAAFEIGGSA